MNKDPFLYRLFRPTISIVFKVVFNPTIENKELIPKEGAVILAGNHRHALDPILVDCSTKRTVHTLAKKELHDGAFGWFFKEVGTIPVDREKSKNKDALNTSVTFLKEGCIINLSPEGKRNRTQEILLPFKYGAVVMAKRTGTKIIPYSIVGDYKFRSKNLKITYDEPIDVSQLDVEDANEELYSKVRKLVIKNR